MAEGNPAPTDRARLRPRRPYVLLGMFDVLIVGTIGGLGIAAGKVPTLGELGPVATALTALVALNVGVITVNERRVADARAAWWQRAQWALEQSTAEQVRSRMAGQLALAHLARSDLATEDDLQLLAAIPDSVVARVEEDADTGRLEEDIQVVVVDVDTFDEITGEEPGDDAKFPAEEVEEP